MSGTFEQGLRAAADELNQVATDFEAEAREWGQREGNARSDIRRREAGFQRVLSTGKAELLRRMSARILDLEQR